MKEDIHLWKATLDGRHPSNKDDLSQKALQDKLWEK